MRRLQIRKKLIIGISSLLCGCAETPPVVACHQFTADEKKEIKKADIALSPDSALHPVIRDYERVCTELKF